MLKKNLFFNILLSISQFIFPLISFPYASRILGRSGIGTVNFIDSFTQYFILFAALGIPLYGVREIAKIKEDTHKLNNTFNQIFGIHIVSAIIFSCIYLVLALLLPQLKNEMSLVLVGITIIIFNVVSLEWFFQGINEFSFIAIRSIIVKGASVILLFVFLKPHSPPFIYYLITASVFVINGIVNLYYLTKKVKIKIVNLELKKHIKPLVVILSSTLAISVYVLLDNILLGVFKGNSTVGIYSTSVRIVKIPMVLISAMSTVIIPQISRAYNENRISDLNLLAHKSFSFICLIGIPICFGLYVTSDFLIYVFAGSEFTEAIGVLKLLSPLVFLIGLSNLFGLQLLTPTGNEKYLLRAVCIGMVFSLALNLLLIPKFSYVGSAIANIITECVVTGLAYYYSRQFFTISIDYKIVFQAVVVAALFIPIDFFVRLFHISYILQEIIIIATCSTIYLAVFLFILKNNYLNDLMAACINIFRKQVSKT